MHATATDSAPARGAGRSSRQGGRRPGVRARGEPLARERLLAAPVRWPRPSRLLAPLRLPGKRMAAGARTLGLDTVGDLLQHLPSDSRESRTLAELRAGEPATVEVVVRSIAARPVRRRGMRPLVEARRGRRQRVAARALLQPAVAGGPLPARARGCCCTASPTAAAASASPTTPSRQAGDRRGARGRTASRRRRGETVAHYPASDGLSSTQILTLVRGARAALADFPELLPAALRVASGLPDKPAALGAAHFADSEAERERARRRLAFEELLFSQLLFLRRRARRRAGPAPWS